MGERSRLGDSSLGGLRAGRRDWQVARGWRTCGVRAGVLYHYSFLSIVRASPLAAGVFFHKRGWACAISPRYGMTRTVGSK